MALVLDPDRPLLQALDAAYLLMLGMGDALGAVLPPQVAVHYGWPDRLFINDGLAGAFCLISPTSTPESHPDWLVAGLTFDVLGKPDGPEPGLRPAETSLWEEGISDIGPDQIIEAFSRHFLSVLSDWESAGLASLVPRWLGRAKGGDGPAIFPTEAGEVEGRIARVAENGDLVLEVAGHEEVLPKTLGGEDLANVIAYLVSRRTLRKNDRNQCVGIGTLKIAGTRPRNPWKPLAICKHRLAKTYDFRFQPFQFLRKIVDSRG